FVEKRLLGRRMFLAALSLSFIARTLGAVVMKSSIIHIERRFDISSSFVGLIDGSFEIGNLLVICFVSYFGSKLHRQICKVNINYLYLKIKNIDYICNRNAKINESGSYMWIVVLLGNMLRGIGEAPIAPLGISYIDDFAKEGMLNAIAMIGPVIGFTMGSLFSKMYVDIGYVDLSTIRITPNDSRWVGAWWLGFLMSGLLSIISSIPFFFLPQTPNKPQKERKASLSLQVLKTNDEKNQTANLTNQGKNITKNVTGFLQSFKSILTNPFYVIFVLLMLLQVSSYIGSFTFIFKYVEQQYGQPASKANILLGIITLPVFATGMFLGGYIIKKFKLNPVGIAKFSFFTAVMSLFFHLLYFSMLCENKSVAGLTVTYDGNSSLTSHIDGPVSYCNSDCNCDERQWEPVCGNNGITYISPCLAGCKSSSGNKKPVVFYNCSCLEVTGIQNRNYSAHLGECPREDDCTRKFYPFVAIQVFNLFFSALGGTSFIMLIVKIVQPELKSLALGFQSMVIRALGGILAPIYFGALIDRTCMKWSTDSCGTRGSCRIYNSTLFSIVFLGLSSILRISSFVLYVVLIYAMKKKYEEKDINASENGSVMDEANLESLNNNQHLVPSAGADSKTHY
uniref:Solute carrier organic anion transporter family member n=1 Tax=Aotus nancymaae TaxID=37293 RepID=A0A2K5DG91_AOTNA